MAFVNIQNLSLTFDLSRLFDGINLTIEDGEKVALVGRNGSGKVHFTQTNRRRYQARLRRRCHPEGYPFRFAGTDSARGDDGTIFEVVEGGLDRIQRYDGDHGRAGTPSAS